MIESVYRKLVRKLYVYNYKLVVGTVAKTFRVVLTNTEYEQSLVNFDQAICV